MLGDAAAPQYLRAADGTIAMGALLALADSVAGLCGGLAALPGWVVSTNLMLRAVRLDVVGPLGLRADVLRTGRNAVVTGVTIRDTGADDRLVADGTSPPRSSCPTAGRPCTSARCGSRHPRSIRRRRPRSPTSSASAPSGPTRWRSTSTSTCATRGASSTAASPPRWWTSRPGTRPVRSATVDTVLHFLAPGRVGPVVARVRPIGARPDGTLVRVEIRDEGADDRVMAVAVATVARLSRVGSDPGVDLGRELLGEREVGHARDRGGDAERHDRASRGRRDARFTTASMPSASAIIEIQLAPPRRSPTAIAPPAPRTASRAPIIRPSAFAAGSPAPAP